MPATISLLRCAIFSLLGCTIISLLCRSKISLFCQTWVGFFANRRATYKIDKHLILKVVRCFRSLIGALFRKRVMGYLIDLASHSVETLKYWAVIGLIGD